MWITTTFVDFQSKQMFFSEKNQTGTDERNQSRRWKNALRFLAMRRLKKLFCWGFCKKQYTTHSVAIPSYKLNVRQWYRWTKTGTRRLHGITMRWHKITRRKFKTAKYYSPAAQLSRLTRPLPWFCSIQLSLCSRWSAQRSNRKNVQASAETGIANKRCCHWRVRQKDVKEKSQQWSNHAVKMTLL